MSRNESINPKRPTFEQVRSCSHKLWQGEPSTADVIASEASLILIQAYEKKPFFFSGKSEKGILSGLFYHLGRKHDSIKTQQTIAKSLDTTEMTVRTSYRDWIAQFPDLLTTSFRNSS
jgi:hypothetical protein